MKRAIALFLAVLFVVTLIPASALAAGETVTVSLEGCTVGGVNKVVVKAGEAFTVKANEPAPGMVFEGFDLPTSAAYVIKQGTLDKKLGTVAYTVESVTSSSDVTLKAVFAGQKLTAQGGVAAVPATAMEGTAIALTLAGDKIPEKAKFEGFSVVSSVTGKVTLTAEDVTARTASFVMPKGHVTVKPIFAYQVEITAAGHKLAEAYVKPDTTWEFTLKEYPDCIVTGFANPAVTELVQAEDGTVTGGKYTMPADEDKAVTIEAVATKLYKVTAADCGIEITGVHKGDYAAKGATVKLMSKMNPDEQRVAEWSVLPAVEGFDASVVNECSFTMGEADVTATETYMYKVHHGEDVTVSKEFAKKGETVTLTANVPEGAKFDRWKLENATMPEESYGATPADLTMPANPVGVSFSSDFAIELVKEAKGESKTFDAENVAITVEKKPVASAFMGNVVDIEAKEELDDDGKQYFFKNWTVAGDGAAVEDVNSPKTTLTVGTKDVTLTANYAEGKTVKVFGYYDKDRSNAYDAPDTELVGGNFVRTYAKGATVTIKATKLSGYAFGGWFEVNSPNKKVGDAQELTLTIDGDKAYVALYYKSHKLTVTNTLASKVFVDGEAQSELKLELPANAKVSVYPDITGVRAFDYWKVSGLSTSNEAYKEFKGVAADNYKFEFTMPEESVTVEAVYTIDPTKFTEGASWLEVRPAGSSAALSEGNALYYAYGDKLGRDDFDVIFYPDGDENASVKVAASDVTLYLLKHGTSTEVAKTSGTSEASLKSVGTFDLKAEYRVGGKLIATSIKTYANCINVLTAKPEYIIMDSAPASYYDGLYRGDAVDMNGANVYLGALVNGVYVKITELKAGEYEVWPQFNPETNGYEYADGKQAGDDTFRIVLGYTDSTQNKAMKWVEPYGGIDEVEIVECAKAASIVYNTDNTFSSANEDGDYSIAAKAKVAPDSENVFVNYGIAGERFITIAGVDNADQIRQVKSTDPSVARIERDPSDKTGMTYKLIPVASGETTIIVDLKGAGEDDTMLLTVVSNDDENTEQVKSFKLSPATMNLYVGSKAALTPTSFEPTTANQLIAKWEAVYEDTETDASYCISVDDNGTVSVNNYTDRKVIIRAYPKFAVGDCKAECVVTVKAVPVTNLTLAETEITLYNKATKQLTATVQPEGATNQNLVYTSSDNGVVSVDLDGNMTALKVGTANVTVASESNPTVRKTVKVTVVASILATNLQINRTALALGYNEAATLIAYIEPANVTTKKAVWSSDDESVVEVDANGRVLSGEKTGTAMITAKLTDGSGLTATCLVTVSKVNSSAVTLNKVGVSLYEAETAQITATVYPSNATNRNVIWSSSNPKIAKVDSTGTITGVSAGGAIITATAADGSGKYADCVVVVNQRIAVNAVTLSTGDFSLLLNDTTTLSATVSPYNASYDKIIWSSSNPNVVSVDENGKIAGRATGQAFITATAGDVSKTIIVTVSTKLYSNGTVINCKRRVNVREKASGTSKFIGYAYLGDTYKVLGMSGNNWYLIQYNATTTGYIWSKYLSTTAGAKSYTSSGAITSGTTTTTTTTPTAAKTLTIINCVNCVNVRSGASTAFSKLGYAYLGTTYTYSALKDGFYEVDFAGVKGYISQNYCQTNG